jgi:hypothetical protein
VKVTGRIELPADPDTTWQRLVAWEDQARWMRDVGPVRVLTSHREGPGVVIAVPTLVLRLPLFTDRLEVVVWDPSHRLVVVHRGLVRGVGSWTLDRVRDGSVFTWSEDISLPAPFLGEFALLVYRPVLRRLMRGSMANLRAALLADG